MFDSSSAPSTLEDLQHKLQMIDSHPSNQPEAPSTGGDGASTGGTGTATAGTSSQPTTPQSTHTQESYILALQQKLAQMTEGGGSGPGSDSGTPQPDQAQVTLSSSVGPGTGGTATPVFNKDGQSDATRQKFLPTAMDFQDLEAELHRIQTFSQSGPVQPQPLAPTQTPGGASGMSTVTVGMNLAAAAAQFSPAAAAQIHAQQIHAPTLLTTYVPAPYQTYQPFVTSPHMQGAPMVSGEPQPQMVEAGSQPPVSGRPSPNPPFLHQPQLISGPLGHMIHPAAVSIPGVPLHAAPIPGPQYPVQSKKNCF